MRFLVESTTLDLDDPVNLERRGQEWINVHVIANVDLTTKSPSASPSPSR